MRVLVKAEVLARAYGIELSYDTSSMEVNAVMGRMFDPMNLSLSNVFDKSDKYINYHPVTLSKFNIKMINEFWKNFEVFTR